MVDIQHGFGYGILVPLKVEEDSGVELSEFIHDNYAHLRHYSTGNDTNHELHPSFVTIEQSSSLLDHSGPMLFNPLLHMLLPPAGLDELASLCEFLDIPPTFGWAAWVYVS